MSNTTPRSRRFVHKYFADEDRDLYYELDGDGFAIRNVDVARGTGEAASAVSRSEWNASRDHGDLHEYVARFGRIVEGNIGEALDSPEPYELLTVHDFEAAWEKCRSDLERRWASGGRDAYESEAASAPRWEPQLIDRAVSSHLFPARRDDGSAEVAAVFATPFNEAQVAITAAFADWRKFVEGTRVFEALAADPRFEASEEGFRIVFEIGPGSTHWKGWAVALLRSVEDRIGTGSSMGFFDVVAGEVHPASRTISSKGEQTKPSDNPH